MSLNTLHTFSGLLILAAFLAKVFLHYYLDLRHQRSGNFLYTLLTPGMYFRRYTQPVDAGFEGMKRLCNLALLLTIISLAVNFMVGLGINRRYH